MAKPLSYDNYSSDTSSQFSTDVIEVEKAPDNIAFVKDLQPENDVSQYVFFFCDQNHGNIFATISFATFKIEY